MEYNLADIIAKSNGLCDYHDVDEYYREDEEFVMPIDKMGKSIGKMVSEDVVTELREQIEMLQCENQSLSILNEALKKTNKELRMERKIIRKMLK